MIRVPMNPKPTLSSTGKTLVVASSHGNKETEVEVQGQRVIVGVNAYIITARSHPVARWTGLGRWFGRRGMDVQGRPRRPLFQEQMQDQGVFP